MKGTKCKIAIAKKKIPKKKRLSWPNLTIFEVIFVEEFSLLNLESDKINSLCIVFLKNFDTNNQKILLRICDREQF